MYSTSLAWQSSLALTMLEGPGVVGIFRVRVIASLAVQVHSTTRTRSNDRASVRFNPWDGCADASGTLGPSNSYFGLVRGAPFTAPSLLI
jgi:hypothetical protein